ncbi:DUF3182 family protein [Alcaligenes faecalis]|uniref:DUF3182 family protein n=1 Tax=Alcaligenes faecalis TaxID=511 RepID=UPI0018EEDEB0|nr:DUF3182 family protein [Alcaligenes faecalis]MBW4787571.1 DUF3182 family protein [Alcaligenes faecalis subsp. faecalis]
MSKILTSPPKTSLQISLPSKGCNKGTLQGLEFMARELAQFLDLPRIRIDYEDQLKPSMGDAYYLPLHTLKLEQAQQLGIEQPSQLYGGVVPYDFLALKTVAHPLPQDDMDRPQGWNNELGLALRHTVLPGYSVFSRNDALRTMSLLDEAGQTGIRAKLASGNAGKGQKVIYSRQELEELLNLPQWQSELEHGLVLEENLLDGETFSIGQTQVGEHLFSYIGQQRQTSNCQQESVYGGTSLLMVRGGFLQLLKLSGMKRIAHLVEMTMSYEKNISQAFPQLYASRRNYDLIVGKNARGHYKAGVLEHSWRFGGASIAEILAIRNLQLHPELQHTHAWTRERYLDDASSIENSPHLYSLDQEGEAYLARFGGPLPS